MSSKKNRRIIAEELAKVGLQPHAIAGVLANIEHESSFGTGIGTGDGGDASGIAQWHPDRFARVRQIAQKMGVPPTNIRAQARALALTIQDERQSGPTGTTTVKSLNSLGSPAAVAKFFDENYERSDGSTRQSRMQAAQKYMKLGRRASEGRLANSDADQDPRTMTWVPKVGNEVSQDFTGSGNYASGNHSGVDVPGGQGGQKIIWAPPVEGKVIGWGDVNGNGKNAQGGAYGNHIIIKDKKGRTWLLAHMQDPPSLRVGQSLSQGDKIGNVGDTGNSKGAHLHIEQTAPNVDYRSGGPVKRAKLVFKVANDGTVYSGNDIQTDEGRTARGYYGYLNRSDDYLSLPENKQIADIVAKAKKEGWTQQKLDQEIRRSDWAKARSETQRTFDTATPAEQQALFRQAKARVRSVAAQMGVVLDKDDLRYEAMRVARDGDSDQQLQFWLGSQYEYEPDLSQAGFAQEFQESLDDMAADYGYTLSDKEREEWTRQAIQGGLDASSWEDDMRAAAQLKFPELRLDGRTLREALTPWLSSAADELGLSYDDFDLTDGKWTDVVNHTEGDRMLSDQEWRMKVRTDDRYGWEATDKARMEYSQTASAVAGLFGGYRYSGGGQ